MGCKNLHFPQVTVFASIRLAPVFSGGKFRSPRSWRASLEGTSDRGSRRTNVQTLKTALVVVALLGVLFAAYQGLTQGQITLPIQFGVAAGPSPHEHAEFEEPADIAIEAPPLSTWESPAAATPPPAADVFPNSAASISGESPSLPPTQPPSDYAASHADRGVMEVSPPTHLAEETTDEERGAVTPATAVAPVDSDDPVRGGQPLTTPLREPEKSAQASAPASSQPRYASPAAALYAFQQARHKAEGQIAEGKLALALLTLSEFYHHPDLDEQTHKELNERLDQLAGTVIYSTRHLLEPPHKTMRGETLTEIASRYNAPVTLLQNINGVPDPELLVPGTELKVLRGPLRAEVDLARGELTLFLGGMYAGRFAAQAGDDPAPRPGEYEIREVRRGRNYVSSTGQSIPAGNPANPYGACWIDLGSGMSLHGSPEAGSAPTGGCLSLAPRDAADVSAILSVGSQVTIR
jgi:LysM repeat protein